MSISLPGVAIHISTPATTIAHENVTKVKYSYTKLIEVMPTENTPQLMYQEKVIK